MDPLTFDLRAAIRSALVADEGLRLMPYECTAGKLSIGVGRNLADVGISRHEALMLLDNDIDRVLVELDRAMPWWRGMTSARQAAFANMAFNLGTAGLLAFKRMISALQAGDYDRAADEALNSKWAEQVGSRAHRLAREIREG